LADAVQIKFGADIGDALSALNALKQAITGATIPVTQLKSAFADASAAVQQNSAATVAAFKANMQQMVAQHAISLDQALGLEIEYTAQRSAQDRARLEDVLSSDAATLSEKSASYAELVDLSARYSVQLAQDQTRIAVAAQRAAEKIAEPYKKAFDAIGDSFETAVTDLLLHKGTTQNIGKHLYQSIVGQGVDLAGSTLSKAAGGLLGGKAGEGAGDVISRYLAQQVSTLLTQLGLMSDISASSDITAANTAAIAAASTTSAGTTGLSALSGVGGAVSAGANAGGFFSGVGSFFSGIGAFLGFAKGGIVPSAARGWALPNFAGTTPALLHAREMVLPATISEGLQSMIAQGSGGGDMHLHFHGPSDGPAVERWFRGLMARNPGVVRSMLRSNALTPRTI
jgi:hypothetical protein